MNTTVIMQEIPDVLYASCRPGYDFGRNEPVELNAVQQWIDRVRSLGVRSILCLLTEHHLRLYRQAFPNGLLKAYEAAGFQVDSVPVEDHSDPPVTEEELRAIMTSFESLPKPVLIHCSAGVDRTGAAVLHLKRLSASSS